MLYQAFQWNIKNVSNYLILKYHKFFIMRNLSNCIFAFFMLAVLGSCKSDNKSMPTLEESTTSTAMQALKTLGNSSNWSEWGLFDNSFLDNDGSIVIEGAKHIYFPVSPKDFQGNKLAVLAKAIGSSELPYRLQINWNDESSKLITSSSEVVYLDEKEKLYSMAVTPPDNATIGYVYLTLHGTPLGKAVVKSVMILD